MTQETNSMTSPAQKELRNALAINRGMQLLDSDSKRGAILNKMFVGIFSPADYEQEEDLESFYTYIHGQVFGDWGSHHAGAEPPGKPVDGIKRSQLREALDSFFTDGKTGLLNANHHVVKEDVDISAKLAEFYKKMNEIRPFPYGNRITTEIFLTSLFRQSKVSAVYNSKLDFRRLTDEERQTLHDPGSSLEELTNIFSQAMNRDRDENLGLDNRREGFKEFGKHEKKINGVPFLHHQDEEGKEYLVTVNGGLVALDKVQPLLEEYFKGEGLIADFKTFPTDEVPIDGYLPNTENLREKKEIDGIRIEDGKAPLFCLDRDIISGLRRTSHRTFLDLFNEVAPEGAPLFELSSNAQLKENLLAKAREKQDERLERSIEIAYESVTAMVEKMDHYKDEMLTGKTAESPPKFYMSMGGGGAGKSAFEVLAEKECGDNFVVASLDEFRKKSDLYSVLIAADHHATDYKIIENMAGNLRKWVTNAAREKGLNVFYDGSGITYQGRYDKTVDEFKNYEPNPYQTRLGAVDISLESAVDRVLSRFQQTQRTLPWSVVVGKHANMPTSFMDAIGDKNLDKITLFNNDGGPGEHYLVGESFVLDNAEVEQISYAQRQGKLAESISGLAEKYQETTDPERVPKLEEDNVTFFAHPVSEDKQAVFVVYDQKDLTRMAKKGQINPHASDLELTNVLPEKGSFIVRS